MRRFSFLLHRDELEPFVGALQGLGLVHLSSSETGAQSHPEAIKQLEASLQALRRLPAKPEPPLMPRPGDARVLADRVATLLEQREQLQQELPGIRQAIRQAEPWGDFDLDKLQQFCDRAGVQARFLACSDKDYQAAWEREYALQTIAGQDGKRYLLLLAPDEQAPLPPGTTPQELPETSLGDLQIRLEQRQTQLESCLQELRQIALQHIDLLEQELQGLQDVQRFEAAVEQAGSAVADKLRVVEGYVPETRRQAVLDFCREQGIVFLDQAADPAEELPPVLLKNNGFTRVFEPITKLFALPDYREPDLTPFFAPFFMLFFGFCLGDAGYGLLLLLGASLYKLRAAADWQPHLRLLQFLGLGTVLFGILTGTFFGFNLLEDQFTWLGNWRLVMLNNDQVFNLALGLGFVQVLFALSLQTWFTWRDRGWKHALRLIGWIVLLVSLPLIFLVPAAKPVAQVAAWSSLALIVLFSDPEAGLLKRFGLGLWDLYNITGFFGDVLSYIRLFALGISSAILGYVVNEIGFQVKDSVPVLGPILFVLFLVVGHGANLLIASLGAFVHPMRLTFLEFYKNAGFRGGGKAYSPFSKTQSIQSVKND